MENEDRFIHVCETYRVVWQLGIEFTIESGPLQSGGRVVDFVCGPNEDRLRVIDFRCGMISIAYGEMKEGIPLKYFRTLLPSVRPRCYVGHKVSIKVAIIESVKSKTEGPFPYDCEMLQSWLVIERPESA